MQYNKPNSQGSAVACATEAKAHEGPCAPGRRGVTIQGNTGCQLSLSNTRLHVKG